MSSLSWSETPAAIRTGGIAALLGFVISCNTSSSRTVNGAVVDCSYTDFGALVLGAVAIIGGLIGIGTCLKRTADDRLLLIGASVVMIVLGVVHLLRGVGTIGGPCN